MTIRKRGRLLRSFGVAVLLAAGVAAMSPPARAAAVTAMPIGADRRLWQRYWTSAGWSGWVGFDAPPPGVL